MHRIFLLSPAHSGGQRAKMLFNERAQFDLAQRLRLKTVPLGEVFSFLSGLYFRGKWAYAKKFARPPIGFPGAFVITSNRGLLDADTPITLPELRNFAQVEIDPDDLRYRDPLRREARRIAEILGENCEVILLGSIATGKYTDELLKVFGRQLRFPLEFVGRGDMSRGGLMLRCAADGNELEYISVQGAVRHGKRPEKLIRLAKKI
ncbi:MAG: hypothetical protein M3Y82_13045 [Verrucomicrobiota bacterium]|nr:hypothetical protein [Verrucomicrobiota bacterium]